MSPLNHNSHFLPASHAGDERPLWLYHNEPTPGSTHKDNADRCGPRQQVPLHVTTIPGGAPQCTASSTSFSRR